MCNSMNYPASALVLAVSRQSALMALVCRVAGRTAFHLLPSRQKKKRRINRCRNRARDFCVWIDKHVTAKNRSILRMSSRAARRLAVVRAIPNFPRRYSSAGTVTALSARCTMATITAIAARSGYSGQVRFIHHVGGIGNGKDIPEDSPLW